MTFRLHCASRTCGEMSGFSVRRSGAIRSSGSGDGGGDTLMHDIGVNVVLGGFATAGGSVCESVGESDGDAMAMIFE